MDFARPRGGCQHRSEVFLRREIVVELRWNRGVKVVASTPIVDVHYLGLFLSAFDGICRELGLTLTCYV
jgi:hypothetical protein